MTTDPSETWQARHAKYAQWLREHDAATPRFLPIPLDGAMHTIESRSLMITWEDGKPHAPHAPQSVVAFMDDERLVAMDREGWVYLMYAYPYGWTHAGHVAHYVVEALQELCYRFGAPRPSFF